MMELDFKKIWEDQRAFNDKLVDLENVANDKEKFQKWNNFYHLALMREVGEVLDTVNWKIHRSEKKDLIRSNTKEELVDCLKYWMSLTQLHGFSYEDIYEEYFRKSAVVVQRYKQELMDVIKDTDDKIVGVDIDGVLADYPRSFLEYINQELNTDFDSDNIVKYNIYEQFGISTELGMKLKDRYRQSGQKRFIPVVDGAKEMLADLREQGYKIVLLTARPYQKYNRIFSDTMEWLEKNDLVYDAIIFDEDKEERLLKEFGNNRVDFFIEDVASNANAISTLGAKCLLVDKPYNQDSKLFTGVTRVGSIKEVINHVVPTEGVYNHGS